MRGPVWVLPGHADDCVTVHLGYGREQGGRLATGTGFNAYLLRHSDSQWGGPGLQIGKTGDRYRLATTHRATGTSNQETSCGQAPSRNFATIGRFCARERAGGWAGDQPVPGIPLRRQRLGHGYRPIVVHGLQRLRCRLPGGKQHPGGRQRAGAQTAGNALDTHRSLL